MSYKCKYCQKEFEKKQQLGGHIIHCKLNPKYNELKEIVEKNINNYNNYNKYRNLHNYTFHTNELKECQYCHKLYKIYGLVNHERYCSENPNKEIKYRNQQEIIWNKGLSKHTSDSVRNQAINLHNKYVSGELIGPFKGKHHTEKSKLKNRLSTIKYIESLHGKCKPRYNKNACKYIDKINIKNNWNLQHAENGGEIKCLGYF